MRYHDNRSPRRKLDDMVSLITDRQNFNILVLLIIAITLPIILINIHVRQVVNQQASGKVIYPTVLGNQVINEQGNPMILRGTQVPSEFNNNYQTGATIPTTFTSQLFTSMQSWHMNIVRIPVAAYYYQLPNYMQLLDGVIAQANNAGLYVVLGNFEDSKSGGSGVLDSQGLQFWTYIAAHYASNPKVFFDIINEPQNTSWNEWLNGNGSTIIGMQQAVNAIRGAGGKQIIIAQAIDTGITGFSGFTSFLSDPNIIYSAHIYFKDSTIRVSSGWDSMFGNLSKTYPIYIGEFAFLPNANYQSFCSGLTASTGTTMIQNFLTYMENHQINWTAWAFNQYHLVQDTTNYPPTFLKSPDEDACCGNGPSASCNYGMGILIQNYLASATQPPTFTPTPTPSPTPSPTLKPTPTPTPLPLLANDTFSRNVTNTWGIASDGEAWTQDVASGKEFSVSKGIGYITKGTTQYTGILGPSKSDAFIILQGECSFGSGENFGITLRWINQGNLYEAFVDGSNLSIIKRYKGVRTLLGSAPFVASAGTFYTLKFRVQGTQLQSRAWVSSNSEPTTWMVSVTDTSLSAGSGGIRALLSGGTVKINSFSLFGL